MRQSCLCGVALLASLVLALPLSAQFEPAYAYATTTVAFNAACDCLVAEAEFSYDYSGGEYDVQESTTLTDTDNTVDATNYYEFVNGTEGEQVNNVAWGDSFSFDAEIDVECELDCGSGASGSSSGPPEYACCGCSFTNTGSGCTGGAGPSPTYGSANYESSVDANLTCNQGGNLDRLVNEYLTHPFDTSTVEGTTWASLWESAYGINCSSFTQANPTPYADAFSIGDIPDWAVFQNPLLQGIAAISQSPPSFSGLSSPPEPSGTNTVYRTPYEAYLNAPSHPNEPHQMGAAIDYGAGDQTIWTETAAWAQWALGNNPGQSSIPTVCVEPPDLNQANPYDHVHIDWRPEFGQGCLASWQVDLIPSTWPNH